MDNNVKHIAAPLERSMNILIIRAIYFVRTITIGQAKEITRSISKTNLFYLAATHPIDGPKTISYQRSYSTGYSIQLSSVYQVGYSRIFVLVVSRGVYYRYGPLTISRPRAAKSLRIYSEPSIIQDPRFRCQDRRYRNTSVARACLTQIVP